MKWITKLLKLVYPLIFFAMCNSAQAFEWRCIKGDSLGAMLPTDVSSPSAVFGYLNNISFDRLFPETDCEELLADATDDLIQIVFFPTGFGFTERQDYIGQLSKALNLNSSMLSDYIEAYGNGADPALTAERFKNSDAMFSRKYRDKFLYIVIWEESPPIGQNTLYDAKIVVRGTDNLLELNEVKVYEKIDSITENINSRFKPDNAVVVFNADGRANASLPNRKVPKKMGITRIPIQEEDFGGTLLHELGHSYFGLLDEYMEIGANYYNIKLLDSFTFLGVWHPNSPGPVSAFDSFWGIYDINLSEIYVAGSDNISTEQCPARVGPYYDCLTSDTAHNEAFELGKFEKYLYEGSSIFLGVYKQEPESLMTSEYDLLSGSQKRVVETAFGGIPGRKNDRIRNAGPLGFVDVTEDLPELVIPGVDEEFFTVMLMGYDEDKFHNWQPTLAYEVEVNYRERYVSTCYFLGIPYSCNKYREADALRAEFNPFPHKIYYEGGVLQSISGLINLVSGENLDIAEIAEGTRIPYETFHVLLPKSGKDFSWKFRTRNGPKESDDECGGYCSDWTQPTRFYQFD